MPFSTSTSTIATAGVFLFFVLLFAVPSGYSYGAALLLFAGCWALYKDQKVNNIWSSLSRPDKGLIVILLSYFIVSALTTAYLGNTAKSLDQSSRALLIIPIFFFLVRNVFSLGWMWAGIVGGVVLSSAVAYWQIHILGEPRAAGFLNIIHFGNIALVFGGFCLGGLFWANAQQKNTYRWNIAFALGIFASLYSVIASGSRGSWVAIPLLVVIFCTAFLSKKNVYWIFGVLIAFAIIIGTLFANPDSLLRTRYEAAVSDITQFESYNNSDTSVGARFTMWQGALMSLAQNPITGWNLEEYSKGLQKMVDAETLSPVAVGFNDNLHNNYLQAWVFQGIAGLIILLALYLFPLWHFCQRLRHKDITTRVLAFCGATLISSYMCFSLTQVILRRNNGIMFFLLALVIIWAALRHAQKTSTAPLIRKPYQER
jgi:O-antigen ligase